MEPYRLSRTTDPRGETVVFTAGDRPISRIMVTTPNDRTRLLKICSGSVALPLCREVDDLVVRPLRNPQPLGDTLWTFYDPSGGRASSSVLRSDHGETGLELTRETLIEFATDQRSVELRLIVDADGATLSAEAATLGGRPAASLAEARYASGIHTLTLTDYCATGCGERIRRVRIKLPLGKAAVTRVCTSRADNR